MKRILTFITALLVITSTYSQGDVVTTDSTSRSTVDSKSVSTNETTVKSPPNSAISPSMSVMNNDICTTGVSGAVQTQILGISGGSNVRDMNCERLKLSKTLFDMGMKVAAVATLCQDARVFSAMLNAGTPCPIDGKIGEEAKKLWDANPGLKPKVEETKNVEWKKILSGIITLIGIFAIF
jgi:hypothetical protein